MSIISMSIIIDNNKHRMSPQHLANGLAHHLHLPHSQLPCYWRHYKAEGNAVIKHILLDVNCRNNYNFQCDFRWIIWWRPWLARKKDCLRLWAMDTRKGEVWHRRTRMARQHHAKLSNRGNEVWTIKVFSLWWSRFLRITIYG